MRGSSFLKRARAFAMPAPPLATIELLSKRGQAADRIRTFLAYGNLLRAYFGVTQLPPAATASKSFCTAGAGMSRSWDLGVLACSRMASCWAFQSSGAAPLAK